MHAAPAAIAALARRARVPLRIARGDLLGGMPCSVWRDENPDEAARFHRVYALFEAAGNITVEQAIDLEQRGVTNESLQALHAERERAEKAREVEKQLREARQSVPGTEIEAFRKKLIEEQTAVALVLGERMTTDRLVQVDRLSLRFATAGDVPALDLIALGPVATWDALRPKATFDQKLVAAPAPVPIMPSERTAADPRPFVAHIGEPLSLTLRNGIIVTLPLSAVGPYDLIVGEGSQRLLVPLHALAAWAPGA